MALTQGIYDSLYIGSKLQSNIGDFSEGEIQIFSYLACLLALYDGRESSSWGYIFIKNENGSPYSSDISSGIATLVNNRLLIDSDKDSYFNITESGISFFERLAEHGLNKQRTVYLNAAMEMVNFFPYGVLTKAINEEPILKSSRLIRLRRNLLDEDGSGQELLYEQFKSLKRTVDINVKGLLMPAYLWLNSLAFYTPIAQNE